MNRVRFVSNLTCLLVGFGLSTIALAQGAGSSDTSGSGDSNTAKPARARVKYTLKLPEEYKSKDTDKDNQIGMYEWPKNDWANFRKLDLNGDGFLTAQELTRKKGSKRTEPAVVVSTTKSSGSDAAKSEEGGSSAPKAESDGPPTALAADELEQQAARFFKSTDKDENGKISEEEVNKSILVRVKIKNAGITPSYPLNREEFARLWSQVAGTSK
jgi:hypothetical protein